MKRVEQNFQRMLVKALRIVLPQDAFVFAIPNGGWRSPVEAAILKGGGVIPGIPDLAVIHAGRIYFLELKAPKGRLSANQRDTCNLLKIAGAHVAVVRTLDEALDALHRFGIPLRYQYAVRQAERAAV